MRARLPALLIQVGLLLVCGCATTAPPSGDGPEREEAFEVEVTRLADAAAEEPKVVRYNPVRCNCPPFEVQLGARWIRVAIQDTDEQGTPAAALLLRARQDLAEERHLEYRVKGDLSTSPEICGQGALYLTLSVDAP